jgi:hypothetical protein
MGSVSTCRRAIYREAIQAGIGACWGFPEKVNLDLPGRSCPYFPIAAILRQSVGPGPFQLGYASRICRDVDGFSELPGSPGAAAKLAEYPLDVELRVPRGHGASRGRG